MATLVIRHPDGTEQEEPLTGVLVVGRAQECDVVLAEGGVSRRHARFFFAKDGALQVEDLGSSNGTFLDGQPLESAAALSEGSRVGVGDYELRVKDLDEQLAPKPRREARASALAKPPPKDALAVRPPPRPTGTSPGPRWVLKGIKGIWLGQSYPISGRMLVGRVPPAAILVEDSSVSRRHAEIEASARGVVVRDLESANGTRVNGSPAGLNPLKSGDAIEFGDVEFSLELMDSAAALAVRDAGGRALGRPMRSGRRSEAPPSGGRLVLWMVAVGLVVVALAGGLMKVMSSAPAPGPNPIIDLHAKIENLLAECRTYAEGDGEEPNWPKAKEACDKVLEADKLNGSAVELLKRITLEQEALKHFELAQKELQLFQAEQALDEFAKIPEASRYYSKAKRHVMDAVDAVKKRDGDDCKRYLKDDIVALAVQKCDRYMRYACQNMSEEELRPPVGEKLVVHPGKLKKGEWRPKDGMYLSFLRVRLKQDPKATEWKCPDVAIGKKAVVAESSENAVKKILDARYSEKALSGAVLKYWGGRAEEAIVGLQKLRDNDRKSQFHLVADDLRQKISVAMNLFQRGEGSLQHEDPQKAADDFDEVLKEDAAILNDDIDKRPSFFRRTIKDDMAKTAYQVGKHWGDRGDPLRACQTFKIGYRYSKANTDLLTEITRCSEQAVNKVREAEGCSDLMSALQFAIDGDGAKEKAAARQREFKCH